MKSIKSISHEAISGLLLVAAAILAMLLANSFAQPLYNGLLQTPLHISIADFALEKPLILWVNDGLMALFFLLVGLEVKREIFQGSLSSFEKLLLPGIAAIAGIVFPALIYVAFNIDDPTALRGWAIPSATDIAFAIGIFSLFGSRLPLSLKMFLLSVAILDDIGAIIIIALFYSNELSTTSLAIAIAGLTALLTLNRLRINSFVPYLVIGLVIWVAVLKSGVHATLAGFAIAWFIPLTQKTKHGLPMLESLEHSLHPWIMFSVLPLFAFMNAGVSLTDISMHDLANPVTLGIAVGLFVGKQVGIFGLCWIAIKSNIAKLPDEATWSQFYAVCLLCGIGFTMSLFIGSLAFEGLAEGYHTSVKLGVLIGSLLSAITAAFILQRQNSPTRIAKTGSLSSATS